MLSMNFGAFTLPSWLKPGSGTTLDPTTVPPTAYSPGTVAPQTGPGVEPEPLNTGATADMPGNADAATAMAAMAAQAAAQQSRSNRGLWIGLGIAAGALALFGVVAVATR